MNHMWHKDSNQGPGDKCVQGLQLYSFFLVLGFLGLHKDSLYRQDEGNKRPLIIEIKPGLCLSLELEGIREIEVPTL